LHDQSFFVEVAGKDVCDHGAKIIFEDRDVGVVSAKREGHDPFLELTDPVQGKVVLAEGLQVIFLCLLLIIAGWVQLVGTEVLVMRDEALLLREEAVLVTVVL